MASSELCRVGGGLGDTKPARLVICVDWTKVDEHMARVSRSKTRIHLDPECLRWTPLVTTVPNPFQEEEKEVCAFLTGLWVPELKCTLFCYIHMYSILLPDFSLLLLNVKCKGL
jgi:hypothetical protein